MKAKRRRIEQGQLLMKIEREESHDEKNDDPHLF